VNTIADLRILYWRTSSCCSLTSLKFSVTGNLKIPTWKTVWCHDVPSELEELYFVFRTEIW